MKSTSNYIFEERQKIGTRISVLRKRRGLTQSELAKLLSTSQSAVNRMEKGEQNFSAETLIKISRALNTEIIKLSNDTINFEIEGGRKLSGSIKIRTSKNSAVALLCASLLNNGKTILKNMPQIEEVDRIIEVLESIDVSVKWLPGNDIEIYHGGKLDITKVNVGSAVSTRSSFLMVGPLVHATKRFNFPHPGGCKLGVRTVRPHIFALEKFGVKISSHHDYYDIASRKLKSNEVVLYESGDTVTENALLAAAKIPGKSVIKLASANYQVQDLSRFLEQLGVSIDGIGTTKLTIVGKKDINADITFYPSEDPIEAMLFLAMAAVTGSAINIQRCPIDFLELELLKLEKMGFKYKVSERYKAENGFTDLVDVQTYPSKLVALEEKIYARPFPGLNIDNLPFFVPIATQTKGQTLIHDWAYENRAVYYLELNKLGADIILADPHRVFIKGPTQLRSAEIICPPALRPAAIILIAMLACKGVSVLRNVYSINRGYEDLADRLNTLGAKINILREF